MYSCFYAYGEDIITAYATVTPAEPDYMDDHFWVAKPITINKSVDVFYVYPTIYVVQNPPNMDISDPQLRKNAEGLLAAQAGHSTGKQMVHLHLGRKT